LLRLTIANVVEWTVDADERDPFKEVIKATKL
jgi:hypothetical protein